MLRCIADLRSLHIPSVSTIRESLAELNLNLDKAGFAVHETLARKRSKDRDYKPRYLAICIGKLIRGDVTWWKNHRDSLAALADVLDVSPDLLLSSASGGGAAARLVLDSFPQLPPLRHDESPCAVTSNGRPLVDALAIGAPGRHVWIVAGAGAGKTLAADLWSRRAGVAACVLHVRTLMEATSRIEDAAAVVIDVDRADGERDPFALVQLTSRVRYVRVLAAFPLRPPKARAWLSKGSTFSAGTRTPAGETCLSAGWPAGSRKPTATILRPSLLILPIWIPGASCSTRPARCCPSSRWKSGVGCCGATPRSREPKSSGPSRRAWVGMRGCVRMEAASFALWSRRDGGIPSSRWAPSPRAPGRRSFLTS